MNHYLIHPVIPPVLPTRLPFTSVSADLGFFVLLLLAAVGMSVLLGCILTKVMQGKGFKCSLPISLILSGTLSLLTVLRFGFTLTTVQGILLSFVLLYASCSDLTDHIMDDFLWIMVAMLGLCSIGTAGLPSMRWKQVRRNLQKATIGMNLMNGKKEKSYSVPKKFTQST